MDELLSIPVLSLIGTVLASIVSMAFAVTALRAKSRFRDVIADAARRNAELRRLIERASKEDASQADVARLTELLDEVAVQLSEYDRSMLHQGLHQGNRAGERRYIADLVSR